MPNNRRIVTPDLNAYIQGRKADIKAEINCMAVGTVVDFDPTETQTVTVQVNYVRVLVGNIGANTPNTDQTENKLLPYPQLVKCPLMILTGGNSYLTFPIEAGDECLILFNDRDIDTWWSTGATGNPPNSNRVHDLNDGIVFVGVRSLANKIANYNMNGPQLTNGGAFISVEDKVQISVDLVTLRIALDALMVALLSWVDTAGDTPNPATVTLLTTAQTLIDSVLK